MRPTFSASQKSEKIKCGGREGGGGCSVRRDDDGGKFTAKTTPREIYNRDALPVWGKGQPSARGGSQGEKSNTQVSCDHLDRSAE